MRRHELSDEQWDRISGLLPAERGHRGKPAKPNRQMVHGILWVLRTGSPWRDLPPRFGPWESVDSRFRRWVQKGVWENVLTELNKDADRETFMIDATIVRAHQDATGAEKKTARKPSDTPEAAPPRKYTLRWTPWEIPSASSSPKGRRTT